MFKEHTNDVAKRIKDLDQVQNNNNLKSMMTYYNGYNGYKCVGKIIKELDQVIKNINEYFHHDQNKQKTYPNNGHTTQIKLRNDNPNKFRKISRKEGAHKKKPKRSLTMQEKSVAA